MPGLYTSNTSAVFSPVSPQAKAISQLFLGTSIFLLVILALVTFLVFYMIIRFRDRPGAPEAKQIFGWNALEIAWTLIPAACLVVLFILMVITIHHSDPYVPAGRKPNLLVVGHQWWWEADYLKSGVVTANEIHIPVGKPWLVELKSADVIHDFWVPELARKSDVVPGHPNHIWLEASKPGRYLGACAEFCGTEHAWMRFIVVAQPQAEFDAWVKANLAIPPAPATRLAIEGAKLFQQRTCANCHTIEGTAANQMIGPDLTHVASRSILAAGAVENSPLNLAAWLHNPNQFKPGSHMPDLRLSHNDVKALTAYLETLK
ncbi:MAG: cytochrome c oxidase subunit II [Candidatus Binataceae bacterium]